MIAGMIAMTSILLAIGWAGGLGNSPEDHRDDELF